MTPYDTIELSDSDSEDDGTLFGTPLPSRETTIDNTPEPSHLDADGDDDLEELLTGDQWCELQARKATAQRSLDLPPGHRHIAFFDAFHTHRIKPGMNVSLVDGAFFRIKHLTRDSATEQVSMHGWLLKRPIQMDRQLKRNTGELALTICTDKDDKRPDMERGLEQVPLTSVDFWAEKFNREIIFTNQTFPALRDWTRDYNNSTEEHWARGKLICRIKSIEVFTTKSGKVTKPNREAWIWLTENESDEGYGVPDISKTIAWRGDRDTTNTSRARSYSESVVFSERQTKRSKTTNEEEVVEIEESEYHEVKVKRTTTRLRSHSISDGRFKLNAGDMCCGAGGVSGGMDEAGFQIKVGVDSWQHAAETFALNWTSRTTQTYAMDISDFVGSDVAKRCTYCHVVHFSLPCQFFAHSHTTVALNEQDEKNIATNLVVYEALSKLRPMYVTFENTSGLGMISKHRVYFNALIKALTDLGFSTVFKIEKLSGYNNPQQRRRLIVIAACPGLPLVDFPLPTHGTEPGLLPPMTVGDAIRDIDPSDPLHNSKELRRRLKKQPSILPIANMHEPLRELISTGGPKALHPHGKRRFTYREGMRLMRFRDCHKLSPAAKSQGDKWKLIGNAVPRDIITLIYKDVYEVLQKWFAEYHAPISLDVDADEEVRPTRKRKDRAADVNEVRYDQAEALPETLRRPFAVPHRPRQRQRTGEADTPARPTTDLTRQTRVDDAFAVRRESTTRPTAVRVMPTSSSDQEVIDLT